jgi:hypothetical protein
VTNSLSTSLTNVRAYGWAKTTWLEQGYPTYSDIAMLKPGETVTRELLISYDLYDMGFSFDQARATAIGTIGP